jgi:hypothetical protein
VRLTALRCRTSHQLSPSLETVDKPRASPRPEAVERFGDRAFDVLRDSPQDLCVIKGITPSRARGIREWFVQVATIANVDSWLRHRARQS